MPDYTENLNLAKPVPETDVADITVLNENMDKIDEWSKDINAKTREATTVIPGIVKFGDDTSTALEGHRMAQIQGVEKFGGDVQIAGTKKVGYAYWCTVNKDMYICKVENSLNYIDAAYFEAFSNNALLGKLNNLFNKENYILETATNSYGTSTKYIDGTLTFKPKITGTSVAGTYPIEFTELETITGTYACHNGVTGVGADEVTYVYYADRSRSYTDTKKFRILGVKVIGAGAGNFNPQNELNLVLFIGRWK